MGAGISTPDSTNAGHGPDSDHASPRLSLNGFLRPEALVGGSLALALGLVTLGSKSWWVDEAFNVSLAQQGWLKYLAKVGYYEPSQALYLVGFKVWGTFTPESEWFTRLPSVAAAVGAAALAGMLGAALFGRVAGVLAGGLLATNATVVAWSQQTRTYTLATFMAVLVTFLLIRAIETGSARRRSWLPYAIAGAIGVYAHFFVGFVIAAHAVVLRGLEAGPRRRLLESWGLVAVAFLPAVPFVVLGGRGRADWIPEPSLSELRNSISSVAGFNAALLVAAAVGAIVILRASTPVRRQDDRWIGMLLVSWAVVPLVAALAVSVLKPVLTGRYLIVSAPALALLAAAALVSIRPRWLAAAGAVVIIGVSAREIVRWYDDVPEDWRGAARILSAYERDGTPVALHPLGNYTPYRLYAPLPKACWRLPGHFEPRCWFRAHGLETLVATTVSNWKELPNAERYVVVERLEFGDRLTVLHLRRKGS